MKRSLASISLTSTDQPARTGQRSRPLLRVIAWELRRVRASRLFWLQALGYCCSLLVAIWTLTMPSRIGRPTIGQDTVVGFVTEASVWGLLLSFPSISLALLVLLLPFITTDGVARDVHRRTHELLLTTAVPTWAYVWGRYLTGLLISLGLAVLMLVALLGIGLLLHLTVPASLLPLPGTVLRLWVDMVVPTTIMVSSLSFALGTLLPHVTNLVKIVVLVGWIVGPVIAPTELRDTRSPARAFEGTPTSVVTVQGPLPAYTRRLNALTSQNRLQQTLVATENTQPKLIDWLIPHLLLAGSSLVFVLASTFVFMRSNTALERGFRARLYR